MDRTTRSIEQTNNYNYCACIRFACCSPLLYACTSFCCSFFHAHTRHWTDIIIVRGNLSAQNKNTTHGFNESTWPNSMHNLRRLHTEHRAPPFFISKHPLQRITCITLGGVEKPHHSFPEECCDRTDFHTRSMLARREAEGLRVLSSHHIQLQADPPIVSFVSQLDDGCGAAATAHSSGYAIDAALIYSCESIRETFPLI